MISFEYTYVFIYYALNDAYKVRDYILRNVNELEEKLDIQIIGVAVRDRYKVEIFSENKPDQDIFINLLSKQDV